ncbi:hypothetical protein GALMADRAFT_216520 [Galerina marginata CBS 339.88]|uniref:Uncharacterized protein n=1 Tax=Galerina marginata (strain CBS 339.88) TaxID=685588 RepID=A0A067S9A7_GALM3|nr:hypothetical protein GALMADRAFT_216520 [Galerina marginata CBS 339.88]
MSPASAARALHPCVPASRLPSSYWDYQTKHGTPVNTSVNLNCSLSTKHSRVGRVKTTLERKDVDEEVKWWRGAFDEGGPDDLLPVGCDLGHGIETSARSRGGAQERVTRVGQVEDLDGQRQRRAARLGIFGEGRASKGGQPGALLDLRIQLSRPGHQGRKIRRQLESKRIHHQTVSPNLATSSIFASAPIAVQAPGSSTTIVHHMRHNGRGSEGLRGLKPEARSDGGIRGGADEEEGQVEK